MKTPHYIDMILILLVSASFYSFIWSRALLSGVNLMPIDTTPVYHHEKTTVEMIVTLARVNKFDVATAIRIADCESKLGTQKINRSGSSAYGLYQFMPKTFNAYCSGEIKSDYDQIICFINLYKKHPNWWQCK